MGTEIVFFVASDLLLFSPSFFSSISFFDPSMTTNQQVAVYYCNLRVSWNNFRDQFMETYPYLLSSRIIHYVSLLVILAPQAQSSLSWLLRGPKKTPRHIRTSVIRLALPCSLACIACPPTCLLDLPFPQLQGLYLLLRSRGRQKPSPSTPKPTSYVLSPIKGSGATRSALLTQHAYSGVHTT